MTTAQPTLSRAATLPRHVVAILGSLISLLLLAGGAFAHEPVVLPIKLGDKPKVLSIVSREGHLSFSGSPINFGDVVVGTSAARSVAITNTTAHAISVTVSAPVGVSVVPNSLALAAGATSPPLSVTWTPAQTGTFSDAMTFAVSHTGLGQHYDETLVLTGTAGTAAALRFDLPTFGETDVSGTDFGMASVQDVGPDAPMFEMTITNTGGLTAHGLRVVVEGPGAILANLGVCHEGLNQAAICVAQKIGTDSLGNPIFEARADFGDLAPHASVTALWRIVPSAAGYVQKPFDIRFTTGADPAEQNRTFDIGGEIIPYSIPGTGFLRAGQGNGGQGGFGAAVDSLDGDDLGALRPTGFDARTVFSQGEIDTVDLRTGSATVVVPITGPQVVRGPLSYELKAVFNSHLWHRRSLAEVEVGGPSPKVIPVSGEYPNPIFNLGTGWTFSLGRLFSPYVLDGVPIEPTCPSDFLAFQKEVDSGPRFVYVDSNGTQHEFWRELHGNESFNPPYQQKEILYARDGSYLRLVLDTSNPNRRWVEEPSGIKRLYVKGGARQPTLPDEWLLQSIEDPYGNKVSIQYGPNTWTIRDHAGAGGTAWRTTTVRFAGWAGRTVRDPMIVTRVELPGWNGGPPRVYAFDYTIETLAYPPRSVFHNLLHTHCPSTDITVRMPRLDRITLADDSAYAFTYAHPTDDRIRMQSVKMPTGATLEYQYASVWDSPPDCKNTTVGSSLNGVSRRTVKEVGGAVLADRRYLRETIRTDDVPDTICRLFSPGDLSSTKPPFSEQTVVVWSGQETGLSTASVHHFNIYPFDDSCDPATGGTACLGNRLRSGRTHIERNLKISHSADPDPLDSALRLSEELYQCSFSVGGVNVPRATFGGGEQVGDDVSVLTNACIKRQTTYAQYEVSRAGHGCRQASAHCLRDSRLKASRTVFHDDAGRWIKQTKDDFDGLGHYRKSTTRSKFQTSASNGRLEQTTFQNWNPGVGELKLNSDHTIQTNISLPNNWILGTWNHQWTTEGSAGRGREACFDPQRGHMTHERNWKATTVNTSNIAANRSSQDLVVRHAVDNATGELDLQRFFGADTFAVPTGNNWCNSGVWVAGNQDFAIDHSHRFGALENSRVVGDSVYDVRRTIDRGTGWTQTETHNSGEVVTFTYDPLGRVTWATSPLTASHHAAYQQQGDGRWNLTAKVFPKGTVASTGNPSPIRIYQASYDGLGRLRSETLPRYNDNPGSANRKTVTRSVFYHPSGNQRLITALDNPVRNTRFAYDYRGRVTDITHPDGSKAARNYAGVRKTSLIACVKTGLNGSGICNGTGLDKAETTVERDWKGRTASIRAPLHGSVPGGFETTFTYDPLDKQTSARRSQREPSGVVAQVRTWTYDGRGFLTRENLPERAATNFSSFTTRGTPRTVTSGGRQKSLTYDRIGRLRKIAIGSRALKRFVFCDPQSAGSHSSLCNTSGPANGKLVEAVRNNYRSPDESGVGINATWLVRSTFGYDAAGRQQHRATSAFWGAGWSSDPTPSAPEITTFSQSWTRDDLGNVTALGYPTCNTASSDCNIGRTVHFGYRQGFFLTSVNEGTLGAGLTYHASGLTHQVSHQGGGGTDIYGVANGMPRIASIDLGNGSVSRFNLGNVAYDFADNITAIGGDVFTYDRNSRLATATVQGTSRAYTYDNFDNHRGIATGTVNPVNNRLSGWSYNTWGNLTSGAGHSLVYDELDKLAGLHEPSGVTLLGIYDHQDLRLITLRKDDPINPDLTWTLRNGLAVIREFVGLGSQMKLRKDYVHGGTRKLASKTFPGGAERHYHEDQVGNARLITGTDAERVHYDPFGQAIGGTSSGERAVGFQGHENDGLTTYMRGRTYLPLAHRFLQVDPGRDPSSWSQFAFSGNNPLSFTDPTGRERRHFLFRAGGSAAERQNDARDQAVFDAVQEGGPDAGRAKLQELNAGLEVPAMVVTASAAVAPASTVIASNMLLSGLTADLAQKLTGEEGTESLGGTVAATSMAAVGAGPLSKLRNIAEALFKGVAGPAMENIIDGSSGGNDGPDLLFKDSTTVTGEKPNLPLIQPEVKPVLIE